MTEAQRIQIGQVWQKNESGESYLVTQLYTEALATFAVLRKTGAENESRLRVRVERSAQGQTLPGFTHTLQSDEF
jgi:hypothetical protein